MEVLSPEQRAEIIVLIEKLEAVAKVFDFD